MAEAWLVLSGVILQVLQLAAVFLGLARQAVSLILESEAKEAPRSSEEDEPRP